MDEALTEVSIDISGRPYLSWQVKFSNAKVGDMDTELFKEWFRAFAQSAELQYMCGICMVKICIILLSLVIKP